MVICLPRRVLKSFYVQKQVSRKFYETVDVISFHWVSTKQTIVYKKTDKWYIEWQRVTTSGTTSDNEWYNEKQRVTRNDNEWKRVTTNDKEWQRVVILANFLFYRIREEPTTMHPKETL